MVEKDCEMEEYLVDELEEYLIEDKDIEKLFIPLTEEEEVAYYKRYPDRKDLENIPPLAGVPEIES